MTTTTINADTIRAYKETDYRIGDGYDIVLRIDTPCTKLSRLHAEHRVSSSAFLTAYNPFSRQVSVQQNEERQAQLLAELKDRGLTIIRGMGHHSSEKWPGEPSMLILGIDMEAAKVLGRKYEQNAFIWCGVDGVPRLVLLR
jgi:hypothetical protein